MINIIDDSLIKPDMTAVLSRTHLPNDIHGFLLPVLEAISNAMDGVAARFGDRAKEEGSLRIVIRNLNDPNLICISVIDNGVGLTDENYKSFKTPFSGFKLQQKGRGFGRFIAFKVFSKITYCSRYEFFQQPKHRSFQFDIHLHNELKLQKAEPNFDGPGLSVEYKQPLTNWQSLIRSINTKDVLEGIGAHFLPYFLYRWLPKISIQFDDTPPQDLTSYFSEIFVQYDSGKFNSEIDGSIEELTYSLTRIPKSKQFKSHCLLLAAADRIVGYPRDLTNKLGQAHFVNEEDKAYIVIAIVRGDAFEKRLNDSRTSINLAGSSVDAIVAAVSDAIQAKEKVQIDKIKRTQSQGLTDALRENPILRLGLRGRSLDEYVSAKPNNWRSENFVSDLAIERFRATTDLTKQISAAAKNPEDYENKIKQLVERLDAGKKEALAEYVIHRKNIISLVESARKYQANGKHAPEDDIHELVFRRFADNVQTGYFEHNLWLIDDALSFLPYISSDRAMHGKGRKAGDKITDILFFDDSMILGDDEGTTLTIVEFKRPSRNDYRFGHSKTDPVLQVIETISQAVAAGGIARTDGTHLNFSRVVRRFAYIIADLTDTLHAVLKMHDFKNDWNPKIYVRYRENERVFIQVFGYETLVELAKKRNQAFFSVLLGD